MMVSLSKVHMVVLTFVIVRSGGICDDGAGNYDSVDDGVGEGIN